MAQGCLSTGRTIRSARGRFRQMNWRKLQWDPKQTCNPPPRRSTPSARRCGRGRRTAAEQCIRDISVIEDRYIGRLEGCASFSKLHVDPSNWDLGGPEQSDGRKCTRIEVMNLIARTGQKDIDSNKR